MKLGAVEITKHEQHTFLLYIESGLLPYYPSTAGSSLAAALEPRFVAFGLEAGSGLLTPPQSSSCPNTCQSSWWPFCCETTCSPGPRKPAPVKQGTDRQQTTKQTHSSQVGALLQFLRVKKNNWQYSCIFYFLCKLLFQDENHATLAAFTILPMHLEFQSCSTCWERNIVAPCLNFIEKAGRICQWGSWVQCWCCVANVFALAVIEGISSFVVVCWDRRLLDFESILANLLTGKSKPVRNCSLST